jgi:EAL domain-containing protein (putative c-di-GMP-specific phosphodiesterase class I)
VPIGEWVLRTACMQLMAWVDAGLPAVPVSVNLSARQFAHGDLVETVRRAMFDSGIDPSLLELEVTESLLMDDTVRAAQALQALRGDGVLISLDDFGTRATSSLARTTRTSDRHDQDRPELRPRTSRTTRAAPRPPRRSSAAHTSVATWPRVVETAEQLAFLVEHECDTVQGFYFSRRCRRSGGEAAGGAGAE